MVLVPQYCLDPNRAGRSSTSGGKRAYAASDAKYRNAQEADFAKFAFRPTTVVSGKAKRCIAIFLKLPLAHGCSILASYRSAVRDKTGFRCACANGYFRCQSVAVRAAPMMCDWRGTTGHSIRSIEGSSLVFSSSFTLHWPISRWGSKTVLRPGERCCAIS